MSDNEVLVVASKIKAYIKSNGDMKTSAGVLDALSDRLRAMCDQAIESARSDGRKTVLDRDFSCSQLLLSHRPPRRLADGRLFADGCFVADGSHVAPESPLLRGDPAVADDFYGDPMTRAAGFAPNTVIEIASLTDVGRTRKANEDCCETFLRADGTRLLVVADGMGGHRGGATASQLAVTTLGQCFEAAVGTPPEEMLIAAIRAANAAIYAEALAEPELRGMGTTVVALTVSHAGEAAIAHVGDSRAYRLRSEQLEALTVDHSVVAEMQMRGLITDEQAAVHPRRNEILRSVGVSPEVEVDITKVDIEVGDQLILCSDGLTGVVADAEIRAILLRSSPDEAVARLVEAANSAGGPDNVTVQIFSLRPRQANEDPDATGPIHVDRTRFEATRAITPPRGIDPRLRQITLAITVASLLTAAYFFYQAFRSDDRARAAIDRPVVDRARVEEAEAAPREGIPRDARAR